MEDCYLSPVLSRSLSRSFVLPLSFSLVSLSFSLCGSLSFSLVLVLYRSFSLSLSLSEGAPHLPLHSGSDVLKLIKSLNPGLAVSYTWGAFILKPFRDSKINVI